MEAPQATASTTNVAQATEIFVPVVMVLLASFANFVQEIASVIPYRSWLLTT
jgi:hypothetical protein